MMKSGYITALVASLLCLALASCTQNNGRIGKYFGSWTLVSMTVDGEPESLLPEGAQYGTMSFQGSVVRFQSVYTPDKINESYALWYELDGELYFSFDHKSDETATGTGMFGPPAWLGFSGLQTVVRLTRLTGSHLDFERTDEQGRLWRYSFDKTL